jgi:hypothetical protein
MTGSSIGDGLACYFNLKTEAFEQFAAQLRTGSEVRKGKASWVRPRDVVKVVQSLVGGLPQHPQHGAQLAGQPGRRTRPLVGGDLAALCEVDMTEGVSAPEYSAGLAELVWECRRLTVQQMRELVELGHDLRHHFDAELDEDVRCHCGRTQ